MEPSSVIVAGGSAGSVNPLMTLVGCFAEDLPAAVIVAIHTAPEARSHLPQILSRAGPLQVRHAVDGEKIKAGRIYVAPPDHHLIVGPGHLHLSRGPRENGHRPAIDPMFRSAARSFGPRVTGVVLSGAADDGAAGLVAIKSRGGVTVAQEPRGAMHPSMPESAVATGVVDAVLDVGDLGAFLVKGAGRKVDQSAGGRPVLADAADLATDDPRLVPTAVTPAPTARAGCSRSRAMSSAGTAAASGTPTHRRAWRPSSPSRSRPPCGPRCGRSTSAQASC